MKQVSLIFNLALSIAVATLFYFHFSQNKTENLTKKTTEQITKPAYSIQSSIAYVNSDTLWNKYKLITDLQSQLTEVQQKKESYLANKARLLEEDAMKFQQMASQLTEPQLILRQTELQNTQMELQTRQQQLLEEQQKIEQQLYNQQQEMGLKIREKLTESLKKYSRENNYQIILAYSAVSDLLYAPDSLEITNQLVTELNEQYNTSTQKK